MYLQITTYCNMSCDHCSFSCEKGVKGDHMSRSHFKKAIHLAEDLGDPVFGGDPIIIGGGEPTMHPDFWEIFGRTMGSQCEYVWMATNGSITDTAMALAEIARGSEKFSVALSTDYFHDPIEDCVRERFENYGLELRDVTNNWGIIDAGAAKKNELGGRTDVCVCDEITIRPTGEITMCGCDDSLVLGHIDTIDPEIIYRAREVSHEETECGSVSRVLSERHIDYIFGRADDYAEHEDIAA